MSDRALTDVEEAEVVARYRLGASTRALAERFAVGQGTVLRVLDRHGVGRRPSQAPHDVDTMVIVKLRLAGHTWAEIARAAGISPSGARKRFSESFGVSAGGDDT